MGNQDKKLLTDQEIKERQIEEDQEARCNLFKIGAQVIKEAILKVGIESQCTYVNYVYATVCHNINDVEHSKWHAVLSTDDYQDSLRWLIDEIDGIVDAVSFESDKRSEKDKKAFFWFPCHGILKYEIARFLNKKNEGIFTDFSDLSFKFTDQDLHRDFGIPQLKTIEYFQSSIEKIEDRAYKRALGKVFGFKELDRLLVDIILAYTITKYILILRKFAYEDPYLMYFKYKKTKYKKTAIIDFKTYNFDHVLKIALVLNGIYAQLSSDIVPSIDPDGLEWIMEPEKYPNAYFSERDGASDFISASHIKSQLENAFHMGAEIPNSLFMLLDKIIKEDGLL